MRLAPLLSAAIFSLAACEVGPEEEPPELEEIEASTPVRLRNVRTGECLRHQYGTLRKGGCENQAANWGIATLGGRFGNLSIIIARDNGTSGHIAIDPSTRLAFLAPNDQSTADSWFHWLSVGGDHAFEVQTTGGRLGISSTGAIDAIISTSDRRRWTMLPPY